MSKRMWIPTLILFIAFPAIPPLSQTSTTPATDHVNPTRTSTNPLFADGVPEHLQCPTEWVGVRFDELAGVVDDSFLEEFAAIVEPIVEEMTEKWNPNRPLPAVWSLAIERQKHIKPEEVPVDFLIQFILDFPEMLVLFEQDAPRATYMQAVEMGEKSPDWNVAVLHDGRPFRMKANYRYEVIFTEVMDVESGRKETKSYYLGSPDASQPFIETLSINLDEMTDAEITGLGGWNYNINPYTTNVPKTKIPPDFVNPTSTSTNPLFADGVPEHLQCPPELVGIYDKVVLYRPLELDPETIQRIHQVRLEILEKWNPNRPLTEVWGMFIEAEKWYKSNAVPFLAGKGFGQERFDWLFQLTLDFPEIFVLFEEDLERAWGMRMVEIGELPPDFNMLMLTDGRGRTRGFRTDGHKKYVFTGLANGDSREVRHSLLFHEAAPEVIHINLNTTSDDALEQLGGWNYNINPYTTGAYKLGDQK